jgi:hypothetical protein
VHQQEQASMISHRLNRDVRAASADLSYQKGTALSTILATAMSNNGQMHDRVTLALQSA